MTTWQPLPASMGEHQASPAMHRVGSDPRLASPPNTSVVVVKEATVAPRPKSRPRRTKSNSQRAKEFRAKRSKYVTDLEVSVASLRAQVLELDWTKSLQTQRLLQSRLDDTGSIAKLVREYFNMFARNVRDAYNSIGTRSASYQESFIRQIMDQSCAVGDSFGPEASLAQWRLYSTSHDNIQSELQRVVVTGGEEYARVEMHSWMSGRISRNTFRLMFPTALHREDLVAKFLHREVKYQWITYYDFNQEGKIINEIASLDLVESLLNSGFPFEDVAALMETSVVTPLSEIPLPADSETVMNPPPAVDSKLRMDFLLCTEDDAPMEEDSR
ncbi:hypothetical protein Poli38472_014414 [Pythium oligandrum]|uniref:BZIP domain-containing protein n=1 Tax=Pythium oligandrum TaxID=41045 RepID=A0A8K1FD06_PYTOL|nr:hypothetical protein Poli38472_014414 [Pythium oligandrum]|eukprot:TMW57811.1 hypothetical protein Poli38472_014414 [Pythium oligandrum]